MAIVKNFFCFFYDNIRQFKRILQLMQIEYLLTMIKHWTNVCNTKKGFHFFLFYLKFRNFSMFCKTCCVTKTMPSDFGFHQTLPKKNSAMQLLIPYNISVYKYLTMSRLSSENTFWFLKSFIVCNHITFPLILSLGEIEELQLLEYFTHPHVAPRVT